MAKGQKRSNREAKKPKQVKSAVVPATPFAAPRAKPAAPPAAAKKK